MSFTTIGFIVVGVWVLIGVVTSIVMGRRGHHAFSWFLLGAIFGPLVVPFVVEALVDERRGRSEVIHAGEPRRGPLSILVGVDGSRESTAALRTTIALFGSHVGKLTLAEVVDYETAQGGLVEDRRKADADLSDLKREAASLGAPDPDIILLAGRPAEALVDAAVGAGCHLLVIGGRGRGATKAVLGSVARQLAGNAKVPVLIVGHDAVPKRLTTTAGLTEFV
jgi:nucleotide-binding universal stress UspA family protein